MQDRSCLGAVLCWLGRAFNDSSLDIVFNDSSVLDTSSFVYSRDRRHLIEALDGAAHRRLPIERQQIKR